MAAYTVADLVASFLQRINVTTAFAYERQVQPYPKLGPWITCLDKLLEENEGKRPVLVL